MMVSATRSRPGVRPSRHPGLVTLTGAALALARRLDGRFRAWAEAMGAQEYAFPPFIAAADLDRIDYFGAFPHLASFPVSLDPRDENLADFTAGPAVDAEGAVKLGRLAPVRHVITPAACYHVYVELAERSFEARQIVTTKASCCRCEAHFAPLERQWAFTMREIVCLGSAEEVQGFLAEARDLVLGFVEGIALPATWQPASDSFYRAERSVKRLYQQLKPVKWELLFDACLAVASLNDHGDHFGRAFGIERSGRPAHSACVAFGLERWIAAFRQSFGEDPRHWPRLEAADA